MNLSNMNSIVRFSNARNCCIIKWRLTEWCNYKCSYCIRKESSKDKPNKDILNKRAEKIALMISKIKEQASLTLIGGEVSFFPISEYMEKYWNKLNNLKKYTIITNFSNKLEVYENIVKTALLDKKKLSFDLSLHDEYVEIEYFVLKVKELQDYIEKNLPNTLNKEIWINIQFVETFENKEKCDLLVELCKNNNIKLKINPCYSKDSSKDIKIKDRKEEERKKNWILKKDNKEYELSVREISTIDDGKYGYPLEADKYWCYSKGFDVNPNGEIKYYSCKNYVNLHKHYNIDTIDIDKLNVSLNPIKCPGGYCHFCGPIMCIFENNMRKEMESYYPELKNWNGKDNATISAQEFKELKKSNKNFR